MSFHRHDESRRRLLAAGLGTAATAGLGAFARSAQSQRLGVAGRNVSRIRRDVREGNIIGIDDGALEEPKV